MRLLLDVHVSGRKIGAALSKDGHDVLAADRDELLQTLADTDLLDVAWRERRILITRDAKDFPRITYEYLQRDKQFAGCIVVVKIAQSDLRTLLRGLRALFERYPDQESWQNRVVYLSPGTVAQLD